MNKDIKAVADFMGKSPVHRVMVLQAVSQFTAQVIREEKKLLIEHKNGLISPALWVRVAKDYQNEQLKG
jgi:hypothetical protein